MTEYVWQVDRPAVWVDRTLATASWWDEYVILPGTYPVRGSGLGGGTAGDFTEDSYYAVVEVDVVRTREYRVNRLFQHSTADLRIVNAMSHQRFDLYGYQITGKHGSPAETFAVGEDREAIGRIVKIEQTEEVPAHG